MCACACANGAIASEITRKRYLPLGIAMWGVLAVIGLVKLLR